MKLQGFGDLPSAGDDFQAEAEAEAEAEPEAEAAGGSETGVRGRKNSVEIPTGEKSGWMKMHIGELAHQHRIG